MLDLRADLGLHLDGALTLHLPRVEHLRRLGTPATSNQQRFNELNIRTALSRAGKIATGIS